jgi:phosphinothricin acetyltransferase
MQADPIRLARPEDAAAIQAIYAPYVTSTPISFEIEPPSVDEMAARMARIGAMFPWLVYEENGEILGYAYAGAHKERAAYVWSADATVYVARGAHRRGIGRALYRRLLPILDLQGFHNVYGGITLPNEGSVGLHEACGFTRIGIYKEVGFKQGSWYDVGWWGLRLNEAAAEPKLPAAFTVEMFESAARSRG